MPLAALALLAFAILVWAGRRPRALQRALKLGWGIAAVVAAAMAVWVGLRGQWVISLGLVALSLYLGSRIRGQTTEPSAAVMGDAQARSILGVGPAADANEIESAHRRLIRKAHPDAGGSSGLAAQVNSARDSLLKGSGR